MLASAGEDGKVRTDGGREGGREGGGFCMEACVLVPPTLVCRWEKELGKGRRAKGREGERNDSQ